MFLYRTAFTEISVLHDVLLLCKERKYIHLDTTTNDATELHPIEPKPFFSVHYKKSVLQFSLPLLPVMELRLALYRL